VGAGFPAGDGALLVAGVDGEFGPIAGDAEVCVLDVGGDDLVGVGRAHAEPLAGDHDDAVLRDSALDADRPGGRGG
jgi:hypothetical protein